MRSRIDEPRSALVLLSGGVDSSTVCLYLLEQGYQVRAHFVLYGQRAAKSEWAAAKRVARTLGLSPPSVADFSAFGRTLGFPLMRGSSVRPVTAGERFRASFVPHRNLLLATSAAMTASGLGVSSIALGIVAGTAPPYPDTTAVFLRQLRRILGLSGKTQVLAPFVDKTKTEVVRFGRRCGFDYRLTYSCHRQSHQHCGGCAGCTERSAALGPDEAVIGGDLR
jgi:7-cyano-7-deazaguanine synthase